MEFSPYLGRKVSPLADHLRARAELAHFITVFGPIEVAKAARLGLEQRKPEEQS